MGLILVIVRLIDKNRSICFMHIKFYINIRLTPGIRSYTQLIEWGDQQVMYIAINNVLTCNGQWEQWADDRWANHTIVIRWMYSLYNIRTAALISVHIYILYLLNLWEYNHTARQYWAQYSIVSYSKACLVGQDRDP